MMKKRAFTFWEAMVAIALLAIGAAILFPVFGRARESCGPRPACSGRLKNIGLGLLQYTQDYSGKFPLVNSGGQGWMNTVGLYVKNDDYFHCPTSIAERLKGTTDYFYNARLAGQDNKKLTFPANTLTAGDGFTDSPSNTSFSKYPANWVANPNSPAYRHLKGANYGYADGHVKWLKPTAITNIQASSTVNTFALW